MARWTRWLKLELIIYFQIFVFSESMKDVTKNKVSFSSICTMYHKPYTRSWMKLREKKEEKN